MTFIDREERDQQQIKKKQQSKQQVDGQWQCFIKKIRNYKRMLMKGSDVCKEDQRNQGQKQKEYNQQTIFVGQAASYQENTNQQQQFRVWQKFLYSLIEYKENPIQLTAGQFQAIIQQIITGYVQDCVDSQRKQMIVGDYQANRHRLMEYQQLQKQKQKQKQKQYKQEWQQKYPNLSYHHHYQQQKHEINNQQEHQQPMKINSQIPPLKNQQTPFKFNYTFNPHSKQPQTNQQKKQKSHEMNMLQTLPAIKQINKEVKKVFIRQIRQIKEILALQMVVNIFSYIDAFTLIKYQYSLCQGLLFAITKRFQNFIDYKYSSMDSSSMDSSGQDGIGELQIATTYQHHLQQSDQQNNPQNLQQQPKQLKNKQTPTIIIQHIKHKLYTEAFFKYQHKNHNINNKFRNATKLLNYYCKLLTHHSNPYQFNTKFYIHSIHTQAYINKHFLIANIINSKCFLCQTQRFISNSLHQVKIYQKLVKKINNILYHQLEGF